MTQYFALRWCVCVRLCVFFLDRTNMFRGLCVVLQCLSAFLPLITAFSSLCIHLRLVSPASQSVIDGMSQGAETDSGRRMNLLKWIKNKVRERDMSCQANLDGNAISTCNYKAFESLLLSLRWHLTCC